MAKTQLAFIVQEGCTNANGKLVWEDVAVCECGPNQINRYSASREAKETKNDYITNGYPARIIERRVPLK